MSAIARALITRRPKLTTAAAAAAASLLAAWFAHRLGAGAMATAAVLAAVYSAAALAAWHRSLHRGRLREARRDAADTVAYLAADLAAGTDPARAIASIAADWPGEAQATARRLHAAWAVAAELGAPAADLCRRLADHLREDEQAAARGRAQTASIRATAALLTVIPAAGVALGESLGIDAVAFLLASEAGLACLAGAIAFQGAGLAWTRALIAAVGTETA